LISRVKCSSERFIVAKSVFWLVDISWMDCEGEAAHSSDIQQSLHHKNSWHSKDWQWILVTGSKHFTEYRRMTVTDTKKIWLSSLSYEFLGNISIATFQLAMGLQNVMVWHFLTANGIMSDIPVDVANHVIPMKCRVLYHILPAMAVDYRVKVYFIDSYDCK
jgi:hypothetical protein